MKIKSNYVFQEIADEFLVVPIAEEADRLQGVIRLNDTGAYLWKCLENGIDSPSEMEAILISKYNLPPEKAHEDVEIFVSNLENLGCLE